MPVITTHKQQGKSWDDILSLPSLTEAQQRLLDTMGPPIILRGVDLFKDTKAS